MVKKSKKRIKIFPMNNLIIRMGKMEEVQDILNNMSLKVIRRGR